MRLINQSTSTSTLALLFLAFILASCSSANKKLSMKQIESADAAVSQASGTGARQHAPIELRTSEQKLEKAKALFQEKNYDDALRLAEQAEVDADLAEAKSRTAKTEKAVDELQQGIRTIQTELDRAGNF